MNHRPSSFEAERLIEEDKAAVPDTLLTQQDKATTALGHMFMAAKLIGDVDLAYEIATLHDEVGELDLAEYQ